MKKSIAKNTAFMTIASVGQKIIAFVYFTIVARTLGAEDTGTYVTALAFTTVFVVFVDLGMTNVLVREAAKHRENIQQYFSTVLYSKLFLGILSYIALFLTVQFMGYSVELKHLIYLSGITMLFDSLHLSIYGTLRAIGNLTFEAIGIVASQAITLILGGIALYFELPLLFLILAFTIPSFLNVLYATVVARRKYNIRLVPVWNKQVFVYLARITIPFALAAVFARVYSYIDTILLSKLADSTAVGLYSVPYKFTFAFQFIPLALVAALYPRFSEYYQHNKKKLAHVFEMGMKYLMVIVFPIAAGVFVLAEDIIVTFFTAEYLPSVMAFKLLMIGLVFSFLSFPVGAFLNACNKQVTQTVIIGVVMVINIILNVLLIPRFGIVAAAFSAMVGNILLMVIGYAVVPQITKVSHVFLGKSTAQLGFAAIIMGFVAYWFNRYFHFSIAILMGVVTYPVMVYVTRGVTVDQLKEAMVLLKK